MNVAFSIVYLDHALTFPSFLCRVRHYEDFAVNNAQIAAATRMASTLKEAIRYQVYVSAFRKKKAFLDILTPRQTLLYQEWLLSNRERCAQILDEKRQVSSTPGENMSLVGVVSQDGNLTLEALCRNLEEILKISKVTDTRAMPEEGHSCFGGI